MFTGRPCRNRGDHSRQRILSVNRNETCALTTSSGIVRDMSSAPYRFSSLFRSTASSLILSAILVTMSSDTHALPSPGTVAPSAQVAAIDGQSLNLAALRGKVALIFYEDKDSVSQNRALKDALGRARKSPGHKANATIVAVADVSGYDWWPARGFVEKALREEGKKAGHRIYCDWSGKFRSALQLQQRASNVMLLDPDGKIVLAHAGPVPDSTRDRILREMSR